MQNNIEYIRIISNTSKKLLSKLLNVSVYTYNGYITNRLIVPDEILILFSKLYCIPLETLLCTKESIPATIILKIESLATLSDLEKEQYFTQNLTGEKTLKLTYHTINTIKKEISNSITDHSDKTNK